MKTSQNRRDFLRISGAGALGIVALGPMGCTSGTTVDKKSFGVGLQLYSIRDSIRKDVPAAIEKVAEMLAGAGKNVLGYLPNLFTLLFIIVATRYTLKLLRFFHDGIHSKRIKIAGLHQELTVPTFQLVRFMILALALVAAYPFLPGSDSPVFRGITIFIGFLLSLGSTSLVTNIVSGIVLTYTRGLRIGDRVKIGQTVGDVLERTLLVTRIRTIKNVVVTIPNGMVLNNEIVNYNAPMLEEGLINNMGYLYLGTKKVDMAIAVFKYNVQAYPKSGNVYDSLGEAYAEKGLLELAIKNYQKAYQLDPANRNALKIIKNLKEKLAKKKK